MKVVTYNIVLVVLGVMLVAPSFALAHQPRITEGRLTEVSDPEVSKAYYGKLTGEPDVYVIRATAPFDLYVNVLVPDIAGQKKDVSAIILKNVLEGQGTAGSAQVAYLDGANFEWTSFYEPFGADSYWKGPEYKARAEAGTYEIRVSSPQNDSKYSLAVGELEAFDGKEGINALGLIPELKRNFFEESPISFIKSPFGWGLIVVMYLFAFIAGFALTWIMKKFFNPSTSSGQRNINTRDRVVRFALGIMILLIAMLTTWNPIIIFISGFCLFEAIFRQCIYL